MILYKRTLIVLGLSYSLCGYCAEEKKPQYRVQSSYRDPFDVQSAMLNAQKRGLGRKLKGEVLKSLKFSGAFKSGDALTGIFNGKMLKVGDTISVKVFGDQLDLELIELSLKPAQAVFKYNELIIKIDK